jgi:hypothetical protein
MHSLSYSAFFSSLPTLIKLGCGLLFLGTLGVALALWRSSIGVIKMMRGLTLVLDSGEAPNIRGKGGLSAEALDSLRVRAEALAKTSLSWWTRVDESIESYLPEDGVESSYLVDSPRNVLPYEVVVNRNFNASLFNAFPGILTGLGLMLTFIAILLALVGVHYDKSNSVEPIIGIDSLINGLSGKFVSSILALLLSIGFTFFEKSRARRVRQVYEQMIAAIGRSIPFLSSSRILLDIQRSSAKASVSVSHISAEVVDRFINGFNERVVPALSAEMSSGVAEVLHRQLNPTMERMTGSLSDLQSAIERVETGKQESMTGEFGHLLEGLERSLTSSLAGMAKGFHEALSGSARAEFDSVQSTLEGTRQMLSDMNGQFSLMQAAFTAIVAKAEETTSDQLRSGREQAETLSMLMQGLMGKLQESADQNLSTMQIQLTRVVDDLTAKVGTLSEEMTDAAASMARNSQDAALKVIEKADASSEASLNRLETLLDAVSDRSREFKEASAALLEAKVFVNNLIMQNGNALAEMAKAGEQVKAYSQNLLTQTEAMRSVERGHKAIADQLNITAGSLKLGLEQQRNQLEQYESKIAQFTKIIGDLDGQIGSIIQTTSNGLRDYNEKVRANFQNIVDVADKLVPKAANMLNTQTEQLGEQLEELGEVIAKAVGGMNGRAH